jgi:hypothetical protein
MSFHDWLEREGNSVASQATIAVGQMQIGEEGYCPVEAVYMAPSSPIGPEGGRGVASTSRYLVPDADVYPEPSPRAKVHVRRLEEGFAIQVPSGEVASRYRRQPYPDSLPVVVE